MGVQQLCPIRDHLLGVPVFPNPKVLKDPIPNPATGLLMRAHGSEMMITS